jgi:hypothetical protein
MAKRKKRYAEVELDLPLDLLVFAIKEELFVVDHLTLTDKGNKVLKDHLKKLEKETGKEK